ncbi:MAG TPA: CsgG/HfaB family protein [Rhodothermales bacterium]|nr:CsgG/HfaB family protein [Rhodothermales bacterium]
MKPFFSFTSVLGLMTLLLTACSGPKEANLTSSQPSVTSNTETNVVPNKPQPVRLIDPRVQEAIRQFNLGEYDEALPKLERLSRDRSLSVTDRRATLEALAEFAAASEENNKAIQLVSTLLQEEPPAYEPDPDKKPLEYLRAYYMARKNKSGGFGVERADPGIKTIAVMDFHNASITTDAARYDRLQVGLPQLMMFQFQQNVNLKVVERARLDWLMQEAKIQNDPASFDVSQAVRVGKMLGAHSVVFGTFIVLDKNRVRIAARLVKVETSEILLTENMEGKPADIMALSDQLALRLARRINENQAIKMAAANPTNSLDAMLAYAEGLEVYHTQGPDLALEKFKLAVQLDGRFEQAKEKIAVIETSQRMAAANVK